VASEIMVGSGLGNVPLEPIIVIVSGGVAVGFSVSTAIAVKLQVFDTHI